MGGGLTRYSLSLLVTLLLIQVTGVQGAMGAELTSLIVAGVLAGVLCVILLFVIPVVCYIRRKRPQPQPKRKTRHAPKPTSNGDAKHTKPRHQQNGIPMPMMNGGTRSPRQNMNGDPPGTVRMMPIPHPGGGPVPMVGTFRGHPPRPIIIGTTSYSKGTYPRGVHPMGNYPMGMHGRGTHSRGNPYMAHMGPMTHAHYPPMAYPYFFGQQYPVQVVYVTDSDESDAESSTSGRSTVRERKSRYHRQFVSPRVRSTIVIKEVDEDRGEARQTHDAPAQRKRPASPLREDPVVMRNRSPSRSRSRSPPVAVYQDLRMSTRPPASPPRKEEQESSSEFGTFQPAAGPKSGDVTFVPKGYKPQERNPNPEPEDYTYATVIKPEPVKAQALPTDDWGEPDQDMGPPSQNIGMSMSERLQGIVEDGWGNSPLIDYGQRESSEVPSQDISRTRSDQSDLWKSRREDNEDALRQPSQPADNIYARSMKRPDTDRPPSPPLDIPSAVGSPRQSFIRDYPSSEPQSPDRPVTPPFDGITPRPSVKSRSESPPQPSTSANPLSQSQSQKVHRSMFSNDVLKELKQRQKSTEDLLDDDDSQSRSVNFSPSPPTIISGNTIDPPNQFTGIPAPPPPPPPPPPIPVLK